jgi:hypothetical protein
MKKEKETKIVSLKLDDIEILDEIQSRVDFNEDTIQDYADKYELGVEMPPVKVVKTKEGKYLLADGFHRYEAVLRDTPSKKATINAIVTTGEIADAQYISITSNTEHGLYRTNADKRKAVKMALQHECFKNFSDRNLADILKVGHAFISKIRQELELNKKSGVHSGHLTETGRCENYTPDGKSKVANSPKKVNGGYDLSDIDPEEIMSYRGENDPPPDLEELKDQYAMNEEDYQNDYQESEPEPEPPKRIGKDGKKYPAVQKNREQKPIEKGRSEKPEKTKTSEIQEDVLVNFYVDKFKYRTDYTAEEKEFVINLLKVLNKKPENLFLMNSGSSYLIVKHRFTPNEIPLINIVASDIRLSVLPEQKTSPPVKPPQQETIKDVWKDLVWYEEMSVELNEAEEAALYDNNIFTIGELRDVLQKKTKVPKITKKSLEKIETMFQKFFEEHPEITE